MKRFLVLLVFSLFSSVLFAQNEIGPDGDKLLWIFGIVLILALIFYLLGGTGKKPRFSFKSIISRRRLSVELKKDRVYFPDKLTLTVKNTGNVDVDLDKPLLIFDSFWLKRKFRIKGMQNRTFYPLYLVKGKSHALDIDLLPFYQHDKRLKRYSKVTVRMSDVKGRRLGQRSVYLRKTLIKY